MALVRWDSSRELDTLQGEVNRLFSSFFDSPTSSGGNGNATRRRWVPAMDLVETKDAFVLKADLPGLGESDLGIEVENNVLTISGDRKAEHEEQHEGYYRLERATGAFSRSLSLPEGIDAEAVQAAFDNGVLTVRIPKPAQVKPSKVRIGVGRPQTIEADAPVTSTGE